MTFCRETFPSEGVSLPPIKEKAFSVVQCASEKSQRFSFRFLLPLLTIPSFLSYFCIVSFTEVYSVKTLLLNKIRKKVSDGIEKKAPFLIILLSYIKTTLS